MSVGVNIRHITTEGERWDQLAYRYYGDATKYEPIVAANPDVPLMLVLPGGLELAIPVIEASSTIAAEELPPWKV
jgi:phage tail protein X